MKAHSSQPPDPIWLRHKTQTQQLVRLTRNVEEITGEDEEGNPTTHYTYDYIDVMLPLTSGLEEWVEENFEAIWETHDPPALHGKIQHQEDTGVLLQQAIVELSIILGMVGG